MPDDNPFGDDAGTRVGRPDTPQRDNIKPDPVEPEVPRTESVKQDNAEQDNARRDNAKQDNVGDESGKTTTGAGAEAARGIHELNKKGSTGSNSKPGSEPLEDRGNEHKSGYGGEQGRPRTSSDQH